MLFIKSKNILIKSIQKFKKYLYAYSCVCLWVGEAKWWVFISLLAYKKNGMKQIIDSSWINPASIYLFKVNNQSSRKRSEICSELTIKTPECWERTSTIKLRGPWPKTSTNIKNILHWGFIFIFYFPILSKLCKHKVHWIPLQVFMFESWFDLIY